METKFIGLEGFNEIESLPTKKRRVCRRELTTAQKTVRFVKRATTFCAKSVVRMSKNTAAKLAQAIENRKGSLKSVTIRTVNSSKKAKHRYQLLTKHSTNQETAQQRVPERLYRNFRSKAESSMLTLHPRQSVRRSCSEKGCACSSSLFQRNHTFMCNGCKRT